MKRIRTQEMAPLNKGKMSSEMNDSILDVKGAALLLGVSKYTIYRLAAKSRLPTTKVGKQWRFHKQSLVRWIAEDSNTTQIAHILKNASIKKATK